MKSSISWLDPQQILMVDSFGLWDANTMLTHTQTSLAKSPPYIIWNPMQVMFPAEYILPLDKISPARRMIFDLLADALLSEKLRLLLIISTKDHISFESLANYSEQMGVGHLVKFASSLTLAQDLIAEHQAEFIQ